MRVTVGNCARCAGNRGNYHETEEKRRIILRETYPTCQELAELLGLGIKPCRRLWRLQ